MTNLELTRQSVLTGIVLMIFGTLCASGADAALKAVASDYAAPQVLLMAAVLSLILTMVANIGHPIARVYQTDAPGAMLGRAVATIIAALGFYQAFVLIPFSQVFLFIGAMPLMAGALSRVLLGERPDGPVWAFLAVGFLGLFCLIPTVGTSSSLSGLIYAAIGSLAGTVSVVLARRICREHTHALAQVFLPQLALAVTMAVLLPFVAKPMTLDDFGIISFYAGLVFCARWIMVVVARLLPAWLTLQLLNMQFVWMVVIGILVFGEKTSSFVFLGAGLIILAGVLMARQELAKLSERLAAIELAG